MVNEWNYISPWLKMHWWNYTSAPPYAFMAWCCCLCASCLIKHKDTFYKYGNNVAVDSKRSISLISEATNGYNAKLVPATFNPQNLCPYKSSQSHPPISFLSSKWMAHKKLPHQYSVCNPCQPSHLPNPSQFYRFHYRNRWWFKSKVHILFP
jgi:hypothetical protein